MSDLDLEALDDFAEQVDRHGTRLDGRGTKIGGKKAAIAIERGNLASRFSCRSRKPVTLAKVNLPE